MLNRLILYGEERSGSLRNPDMHAFEQGLLWLEENPLIDPIMRASLIHYLEVKYLNSPVFHFLEHFYKFTVLHSCVR